MAYGQIDPARLEGDDLTRWYLRSPTDVEEERRAAAAGRYADFFGAHPQSPVPARSDTGPSASGDPQASQRGDMPPTRDRYLSVAVGPGPSPDAGSWALDSTDTSAAGALGFATTQNTGSRQIASSPTKDQCIKQCTPLLERPQRPGSDRNRWDFHKCVNACMDPGGRLNRSPAPSSPSPPAPSPRPIPWWMWVPRLIPEAAALA